MTTPTKIGNPCRKISFSTKSTKFCVLGRVTDTVGDTVSGNAVLSGIGIEAGTVQVRGLARGTLKGLSYPKFVRFRPRCRSLGTMKVVAGGINHCICCEFEGRWIKTCHFLFLRRLNSFTAIYTRFFSISLSRVWLNMTPTIPILDYVMNTLWLIMRKHLLRS